MKHFMRQPLKKIASIKNISKKFAEKDALVDVSLDIYPGEILSILGPNGAGKTTLINIMLGRLSAFGGEIEILGLQPGSIELKRQCGAMLQVSGLPDMSTVKEHIELFRSYYPSPMEYGKTIELAGLVEIEDEYSKNLSGGQKQRLLFALAICGNPKLLFLDEPSVGLDVIARKLLWKAITELKEQGTSIVLTTHYLEEADQLSDRIIMLNQGCVIQEGTPEAIKKRVSNKTIRFISSISAKQLSSLKLSSEIKLSGNYYEIQTRDPVSVLTQLFSIANDISDLSVSNALLEDAFLLLNSENDAEQSIKQKSKKRD